MLQPRLKQSKITWDHFWFSQLYCYTTERKIHGSENEIKYFVWNPTFFCIYLVRPILDALTPALSLACLEIRSRNEEAINSTWNRIYLLKVFHFLLYRRSCILQDIYFFFCFWIDLVRVLATNGNTSAVQIHENSRASIPEKSHHCQG